jgi:hypothetical protein
MKQRSVSATIVGSFVAIGVAIASCSFPTYNITVTGSGGASATASGAVGGGGATATSSASIGGAGGASASSASSGSVGGGASTSTSTASATSSTSSGPCSTDEDQDGAISWQCAGGTDCADQDPRAHPNANFTAGAAIMGLRSPVTLPYDFNCDKKETKQTVKLNCPAICFLPGMQQGFPVDVDCDSPGMLGHCAGGLACKWTSNSANMVQICK